MVRKIKLRVSLQQLVAGQKGPAAGRAALGGQSRSPATRTSETGARLGPELGDTRGVAEAGWRRKRRGCSGGGRAL